MGDRIVIDPLIHHGKPVITGTHVPVATLIGALAGGMSWEEVMREYEVRVADIEAGLSYEREQATIAASATVFSQLDSEEERG